MVKSYKPSTLKEALELRASYELIPYSGGTDVMVKAPKDTGFLFLNDIKEIKNIKEDNEYIRIGAGVTFTKALQSELIPEIMKEAVSRIAAPAIRNAGTFGGNLGNSSDKADSVLVEFALDAFVKLESKDGERIIPVSEFFVKRGENTLRDNELITEILLPKDKCEMPYYYKKVGGRNALAISRVALAGVYDTSDGVITHFSAAFIGSGAVFRRCKEIEKSVIGKRADELKAMKDDIIAAYKDQMVFSPGRVTPEYRENVSMNLLRDYLDTLGNA